jgi:hypothetical protein
MLPDLYFAAKQHGRSAKEICSCAQSQPTGRFPNANKMSRGARFEYRHQASESWISSDRTLSSRRPCLSSSRPRITPAFRAGRRRGLHQRVYAYRLESVLSREPAGLPPNTALQRSGSSAFHRRVISIDAATVGGATPGRPLKQPRPKFCTALLGIRDKISTSGSGVGTSCIRGGMAKVGDYNVGLGRFGVDHCRR